MAEILFLETFFSFYISLFPVMCVPACCRRNITSASLCSWMRPGSCFMMNNYHFLFFLSRTFLATRRKYIYLIFCFPSMNYTAPREQLYFLHLAYAEREMVKTEWVFFFMQVITLTENTVSQGCIAPLSKLFSVEELRPNLWLRDFWTSWIKLSV